MIPAACEVEGCDGDGQRLGLCDAHYARQRTKGSVGTTPIRRIRQMAPCPVCQVSFVVTRDRSTYCGRSCRSKAVNAARSA